MQFEQIFGHIPFILEGVGVTLKFTFVSLLCGLPLGVLLAITKASNKGVLYLFAQGYTSVFRGTPLLVQLALIFFALPQIIGFNISAFAAGVITFALNSAAYSSEIMRAGIQSVDPGQIEAAKVLGLNRFQINWFIIMPQALRNILPALVNEIVDLLKESALVSVIGEMDLLRRAQIVASQTYLYFEPLLIAALAYYCMVLILSKIAKLLERHLAHA